MEQRPGDHRVGPGWSALILLVAVGVFISVTSATFAGVFRSYVTVTVSAERSGIIMEPNAKVKMRGVEVGRVDRISNTADGALLELHIQPDQLRLIPANIEPRIDVTTAFGSKFVNLVVPAEPSNQRLAAGALLRATNGGAEINSVFENVVELVKMIDPAKLNSVLTAVAEAVRGKGDRMGEATTALNRVLTELNARNDLIQRDWRSFKRFNDTYAGAAQNILTILDSFNTTSETLVRQSSALDVLLMNAIGFGDAATDLLATNKDNLKSVAHLLAPTADLLFEYSPTFTCMLVGTTNNLKDGAYSAFGGADGRSLQFDVALLPGNDPYRFPDNLPIVAAKGGPGGKPSCGSLPDVSKNFPVRQLITNTGWGTGLDARPNPGIGYPCAANWFPVTRAVPERPGVSECLPGPAIGPSAGPDTPPYGAPMYAPGGQALWPGVSPAGPEPGPVRPEENGQSPP